MRKKNQPPTEVVHLPEPDRNPDRNPDDAFVGNLPPRPAPSPEYLASFRTWAEYAQETNMDRASYDNAVDEARRARDSAYQEARKQHSEAIKAADDAFDKASTAAWKTYHTNTDAARRTRDSRLDEIRNSLAYDALAHAQQQAIADGGYEVFGDEIHAAVEKYEYEKPCRYCGGNQHDGNAHGLETEDGEPRCVKNPETPAAPADDRAGNGGPTATTAESAAE